MTISIKNTISILTLIFSLSYSNSYDFPYRFSINRYTNEWNQNFRSSPNSLTKSTLKSPAQNFTNKVEEYMLPIQLATFLYLEYGIDHHTENNKRSAPNKMDEYFRGQLKWSSSNMNKAVSASDFLLYGVYLGTVPIVPLFSNNGYLNAIKASLNVISINGILTDIVKMTVKRQRPDSFFETREDEDDSFRSFFSGHTSTTFAIGTSNAIILSKSFPEKRSLIWLGSLSLSAATGYFRMAGDKHYFSDVICGGLVGYAVGKLVHGKIEKNKLNLSYGIMDERPMLCLTLKL